MILNNKNLSRTIKKPESVGEKRVQYFCFVPKVRFLFKNKKSVNICTNFRQFCLQNLITYLKVVLFIIFRGAEGPGREILQRRPSVCLSVRPSVRLSVRPSRLVFAL